MWGMHGPLLHGLNLVSNFGWGIIDIGPILRCSTTAFKSSFDRALLHLKILSMHTWEEGESNQSQAWFCENLFSQDFAKICYSTPCLTIVTSRHVSRFRNVEFSMCWGNFILLVNSIFTKYTVLHHLHLVQMMLCWLNQSWNKKILVNPIISHEVLDFHKLYIMGKREIQLNACELHEKTVAFNM